MHVGRRRGQCARVCAEHLQRQCPYLVGVGVQRHRQLDLHAAQRVGLGHVAHVFGDQLRVRHDHRGAVPQLDLGGAHVDPADVALDLVEADPVAHLHRPFHQQDQAGDEVLHDRLQAEADAHRQRADDPGDAGQVDVQRGQGQHQHQQAAEVAEQGDDGILHARFHRRLGQQLLAQPALEHVQQHAAAHQHQHRPENVAGIDRQIAQFQVAEGA